MENEEFIYKNKESNERKGQFFGAQNPEMLEKFEATHEYIKKLYEHSKGNLIFHLKGKPFGIVEAIWIVGKVYNKKNKKRISST